MGENPPGWKSYFWYLAIKKTARNSFIKRGYLILPSNCEDYSRDSLFFIRDKKFVRTEYKVVDIFKTPRFSPEGQEGQEGIYYIAKTDKGDIYILST